MGSMDVHDIRKRRVSELIEAEGSVKAFAEKIGSDPNYISATLSDKTKRNIGAALARRIELAYSLPKGTLDQENDIRALLEALPPEPQQEVFDFIRYKFERSEHIAAERLPQYMGMIDRIVKDLERRKKADDT